MAGVPAESAYLGWHGVAGDRRFAFRKIGDASGFPWLTASRVPELLLYHPAGLTETAGEPLPTHVRTPSGTELELRGDELRTEIGERFGGPVEMMMLKHGIFDDAAVSVISTATIGRIGQEAGVELDRRRMRANVLLDLEDPAAFLEDQWPGGTLVFGDGEEAAAVSITARDLRCVMINLDPDTGQQDPRVMKAAVRLNGNYAGAYGTVVRAGMLHAGQTVSFHR
jgi:uncharacterized protein